MALRRLHGGIVEAGLVSCTIGTSGVVFAHMDEVAYDRTPLKAAHSMMQLWSEVKDDIALVRQPVLLFRSAQDNVVEASNAEWILTHVASTDTEEIVLADSQHVATLDHDAQTIIDGSVEFIERLRAQG